MIIATGNNFGAGQIEFKEYLSDNMIILNGRFSFDYTKEEYLNADVLEIYVPELPMKRSLETAVFLTYENTYGRMGTIVKSWIKNKTTICLENLEINSKYGSREFWFMCAYLPKGQRNTFEVEGQVDLHLDNLPWNFREEHAWAVVREKWAYLCFVIEGFYQAEPDTSFAIDLVNFPTDIVSEVPYVAQTTNKSGFGSHVMSCTVSEGKFNNPGCTEAFLKDASSSFVKVFIVR